MKTLFSLIIVAVFATSLFSADTTSVKNDSLTITGNINSTKDISIVRNGKSCVVDSIVKIAGQLYIYIDGIKTPVISSNNTQSSVIPSHPTVKNEEKVPVDTLSKTAPVNTVNKASNTWPIVLLILLGIIGVALILMGIFGRKNSNNSSKEKSVDQNSNSTINTKLNSASPRTQPSLLKEDNRVDFIPVIPADHAPAYPNMPERSKLHEPSLPSMIISAYANTPNIVRDNGYIVEISNIKHGKLNGRFSMEHSDGSVSIQNFNNEQGFRAKAKFSNGKTALIYSRYSCLNNVRGVIVAEVLAEPTFTEDVKVVETKKSRTVTSFTPESVAA